MGLAAARTLPGGCVPGVWRCLQPLVPSPRAVCAASSRRPSAAWLFYFAPPASTRMHKRGCYFAVQTSPSSWLVRSQLCTLYGLCGQFKPSYKLQAVAYTEPATLRYSSADSGQSYIALKASCSICFERLQKQSRSQTPQRVVLQDVSKR